MFEREYEITTSFLVQTDISNNCPFLEFTNSYSTGFTSDLFCWFSKSYLITTISSFSCILLFSKTFLEQALMSI